MIITLVCVLIAVIVIGLVMVKRSKAPKQNRRLRHSSGRAISEKKSPLRQTSNKLSDKRATPLNEKADSDEILGLKAKPPVKETLPDATKNKPAQTERSRPADVIALTLIAPANHPYRGYELLQALLAVGLRFGDMKIFHRHETKNGRGPVWFSLANIEKPGTFDLQKMGATSCKGLMLFMQLAEDYDCAQAFECMLETVRQLAEDLGGEVWDDSRQRLTMDKVTDIRRKIRSYEASQRVRDLFEVTENQDD